MLRFTTMASAFALFVVASACAAEPIGKTDGEISRTSVEVDQLTISNGTALLTFRIKNDGQQTFRSGALIDTNVIPPDYRSVSGVYLVDAANKTKYLVMYDSAHQCLCSRGVDDVGSNSSAKFSAKFPAPPADVRKVGIVIPHFLPLD